MEYQILKDLSPEYIEKLKRRYGVSSANIYDIIKRNSWKHI